MIHSILFNIVKGLLIGVIFMSSVTVSGQLARDSKLEASTKILVKVGMGYDKPMADLADRFGGNINKNSLCYC